MQIEKKMFYEFKEWKNMKNKKSENKFSKKINESMNLSFFSLIIIFLKNKKIRKSWNLTIERWSKKIAWHKKIRDDWIIRWYSKWKSYYFMKLKFFNINLGKCLIII